MEGMKPKPFLRSNTTYGTGVYLPPIPVLKEQRKIPPPPSPQPSYRPPYSNVFFPNVSPRVFLPEKMISGAPKYMKHKKIKQEWRIRSKPMPKEEWLNSGVIQFLIFDLNGTCW